jgi:hypothetical protein
MFTLGILCLFLGFIIAIMIMMALGARGARGEDTDRDGGRDGGPGDDEN